MRVPDADRLVWAEEVMTEFGGFDGGKPKTLPHIYAREQFYIKQHPKRRVKLQAIRIGDLGIAAISAEVFGITGLKLKLQSPFEAHMNFSLANGEDGYIPPPEQHRLGGYTTWEARTAGLEVQAEPRIVSELLQMLEEVAGCDRRPIPPQEGPYVRAVLDSRPVGYWQLDELSGDNARNRVNTACRAIFRGDRAFYLPGPPDDSFSTQSNNRCVHFVGGSLCAAITDVEGDFSIEAWFWNGLPADVRPLTGTLFSLNEEQNGPRLVISGTDDRITGRLAWITDDGKKPVVTSGKTPVGTRTWNHVVVVGKGDRVSVFLNGEPELEARLCFNTRNQTRLGGRSCRSRSPSGTVNRVEGCLLDRSRRAAGTYKCGLALPSETEASLAARSNAGWGPLQQLVAAGGRAVDECLEGRVDELAVYGHALTASDVQRHFRISGMPAPAPQVPQAPSTHNVKPRK
jgi:hypothetical protein